MGAVNNLSIKETMILAPGELYDMYELYLIANGLITEGDDE
jgi:hypothetical protein